MAFEKIKKFISRKKDLPGGLWTKCESCQGMIYRKELEEKKLVCPQCGYHFTMSPTERIDLMLDPDSFTRMWTNLEPMDPLNFEGVTSYKTKLAAAQKETGEKDAVWAGTGRVEGRPIVFGLTDSRFMMGSMGSVVGETIARAFEYALDRTLPLVFVSGSGGGARMYEGALSLMQMAKTSAAISRFSDAGGLYISVLTNPTMAGVMASFAALGDVTIAEPRALIGFTGPRVIEQTIRQELPKGFQTSEFLLEHGFIDLIVERPKLRPEVARLIDYLT
ncbi:MAG TPA: acetyl-CoA carboxylase, carboxyltransferase subunit beta [Planctomycetota bacterium]|nr:acetyl-CoA carboxylase, carboxyltransferase subunit beta [Planctomycetota bacterium]